MIKLFRKIRQRLLSENKFSKYFLYAIGEIVLVVIGILIALSINNWNENKKKEARVNLYLNNLIENLQEDIRIMGVIANVHAFRFHSLQYLMEHAGVTTYDNNDDGLIVSDYIPSSTIWNAPFPIQYNKEFIQKAFQHSIREGFMNLNTSTVDEMKNNTVYAQIQDKKIKNHIMDFYARWDRSIGPTSQEKFTVIIEKWQASLGEEGFLSGSTYTLEDPLQLLRNNKKRIYLLKRVIRESAWFAQSVTQLSGEAEELIDAIEGVLESEVK